MAVLLVAGFIGSVHAAPLFESFDTLEVEITAPLSTLVRERSEDEDLQGVFSYRDANGSKVNLDIRVHARGNFRRRHCDFPPLELNFRKSQLDGTLFDGQNKLKLVAHCKITRRYEQSVIREYLAYRMFNQVTDQSFRVRLLTVTWIDSDERRGRMVRNAFLIEQRSRLADRTGLERKDIESADVKDLEPEHLNLASMFQYLVGNFDFSPLAGSDGECCHNYEMYADDSGALIAIPYDFDFSGLVNAPNAVPNRDQGVERIGQRVYHGYCENNEYVEGSVARYRDARGSIYALVDAQEELEPAVRESIAQYVDGFYAVIDDPAELREKITGACK